MNRVILTGRLTKDPEVRYTSSGKAVCGIRLAECESVESDSGELREVPG